MAEHAVDGIVVDTAPLYCEGLVQALRSALRADVRAFTRPVEALQFLREQCRDLAVIGPDVEEAESLALCRAFMRQCPTIKTVLVSREAEDPVFQSDALRAGANACLPPEIDVNRYVEVVTAVLAGHQLFSRAAIILAQEPVMLTVREREVLLRLAEHKTDAEIASELGLSVATIRKQSHGIIKKLTVHERREALRRARRLGWLPPPAGPQLPVT